MKKLLLILLVFTAAHPIFSIDKLKENYLITFGDSQARIKIIEYFSFACPHCINHFRKDFPTIKNKYLDQKEMYWIFHPVPMDLLTVQAMDCLEKLSEKEKRIFLEVILTELIIDESALSCLLMKKAMEVFGKPISQLEDKTYLSNTKAFQDAFNFLKQEEKVEALPTVEIDGKIFHRELPDAAFIDSQVNKYLIREQKNET